MNEYQTNLFDYVPESNPDQRSVKKILPTYSGKELRDKGIEVAKSHANAVHSEWSETAYNFLLNYLDACNCEFLCENVRQASDGFVPIPPSLRSWGAIMTRAIKSNLIKKIDCIPVKSPNSHCANANLYIKV